MNAKPKSREYSGPERRVRPISDRRCETGCFEHSGLVQRIENIEEKAQSLDRQGFLTISAYRWTTGILLSILISVIGASVYVSFQASEALREVKASQATVILQIKYLQQDIDDLKRAKMVKP